VIEIFKIQIIENIKSVAYTKSTYIEIISNVYGHVFPIDLSGRICKSEAPKKVQIYTAAF
jgi:hypothetical protein